MSDFSVYPAIDLRRGRVVRLRQGDPGKETVYSEDPVQTARTFLEEGAGMVHVINLDGAFNDAQTESRNALLRILETGAQVQFGGGVRSLEDIDSVLEMGVYRVILGTVVVVKPILVAQALEKYGPERIVVGIDVRKGRVYTHGWKEQSIFEPVSLVTAFKNVGLRTLIYTSIVRDGTGEGLNVPAASRLAEDSGLDVIAAGGVASLKDLRSAREAGLRGVVIGKALYDGMVTLKKALAC